MRQKRQKLSWSHHGVTVALASAFGTAVYMVINKYAYKTYGVKPLAYMPIFLAANGIFGVVHAGLLVKRGGYVRRDFKNRSLYVYGAMIALSITLLGTGQYFTTALNASIIFPTIIIWTVLFSWLILREKITYVQALWCGVFFVGLYLAIVGTRVVELHVGDIIIAVSALCMGFANAYARPILRRTSPVLLADIRVMVGGFFGLLTGLITYWHTRPSMGVTACGISAGLSLYFSARTFIAATVLIGPNYTSVLNNVQVVLVGVGGVLILSEQYTWEKLVGSVIVLVSIYAITWKNGQDKSLKSS